MCFVGGSQYGYYRKVAGHRTGMHDSVVSRTLDQSVVSIVSRYTRLHRQCLNCHDPSLLGVGGCVWLAPCLRSKTPSPHLKEPPRAHRRARWILRLGCTRRLCAYASSVASFSAATITLDRDGGVVHDTRLAPGLVHHAC